MPFTTRNDVRLYWRRNGRRNAPALMLLNSVGTDMGMWDRLVPLLEDRFDIIRLDARGHGASDVPAGDYSMDMLADDALSVLDAAGVGQASLCGLSMGGMIALQMALKAPDRVLRVIVANSSAQMPSDPWIQRAALVRQEGMGAVTELVRTRFFSDAFRASDAPAIANVMATLLGLDPQGYAAAGMAIAGLNIFDRLPELRVPLLVINGDDDVATPGPQHGDRIAGQVPGAVTASLAGGHLSAVEVPEEFADIIGKFLAG